jgi:hypothetical protein
MLYVWGAHVDSRQGLLVHTPSLLQTLPVSDTCSDLNTRRLTAVAPARSDDRQRGRRRHGRQRAGDAADAGARMAGGGPAAPHRRGAARDPRAGRAARARLHELPSALEGAARAVLGMRGHSRGRVGTVRPAHQTGHTRACGSKAHPRRVRSWGHLSATCNTRVGVQRFVFAFCVCWPSPLA